MYEWMEENWTEEYDGWDLGEVWEHLEDEWDGRNNLEDIISYEDFLSHYSEGNV
jgi:hypothetical protein